MYDGRKTIFCIHRLKFDTASQEFDVTLADEAPQGLQDQVDPRRLHRFIESKGSHNNTVLTAITVCSFAFFLHFCAQSNYSGPQRRHSHAAQTVVPVQRPPLLHGPRDQGHWPWTLM
jgi:hypothetical protein